ncbi:glycoside hydrolase family 78 protein [Reichenbachiella ulvae]|uniref:alpha-L-rhamnosidase n=1 Tax=Reichenbachiella ulvae TaxID=2980104 RepID=A0ABT3CST1_9BACT|nr:glycoside hydrolase family 78 protein [Reichenbachiella ulvae]MCV9386641.1 glycoside hydrolase family 78 protein [Reichenbachiella ulvae]
MKIRRNTSNPYITFISVIIIILICVACGTSQIQVNDLKCEYKSEPLGIDNTSPRLSWKLVDPYQQRGQNQTDYHVLVASSMDKLSSEEGDLWDTGKTESQQSVNVIYDGKTLTSNQECFWKVRVWDKDGKPSDWSESSRFSIGLLTSDDWQGEWILKDDQLKTDHNWYRKNFNLKGEVQSAFVYLASFGYHELYVNGQKVGDEVLNPASSFMKKRIRYLTYDIKDFLQRGENVIAVWHAGGWARWSRVTEYMNPPFVFKAQAEIMTGEQKLTIVSDKSWKCKKSHSQYIGNWDILDFGGEIIDDRLREDDWNTVSYDDSKWANATVYDHEVLNSRITGDNVSLTLNSQKSRPMRKDYEPITTTLSGQMVEPQVKYKEISPIRVSMNSDSTYLIDMGENYTGFFEMNLFNGIEGDTVTFEIADRQEVTSSWKQRSQYIYSASGKGQFTNRFNVAGGRWVTVYGLGCKPDLKDIKGYVVTSNRKQISSFESSSELLNRIYQVNLNTYLANTMDGLLVDCPHRERRGWGEVTVAAMYGDALPNYESGAYMEQYLQYMRDAQLRDGRTRAVLNEQDRPFLMWKANSPITIWEAYRTLGDPKILKDNYASMKKWMEWMHNSSQYESQGALKIGERGKREMPGLGDWCTPRGNFWDSSNSPDAAHFNNCVYAFMLECAMNMAEAVGEYEDATAYSDRLEIQKKATHQISYNAATGQYLDGKQVDQAFALLTGVTPESEKEKVLSQLENNVLYDFPYYDTGSSGQALYTRYFIEHDRMDLIYELLRDKSHPSYGYFLEQGKTTWPERWSAIGNSQIHTCYTGIGGYFLKGFGGIRLAEGQHGFQNFTLKPSPVGDLTYANTTYESLYGTIVSNWKIENGEFHYHIEVPVNSTAKVFVPAKDRTLISEGGLSAEQSQGMIYVGTEQSKAVGNYIIYEVGSGQYDFVSTELPENLSS